MSRMTLRAKRLKEICKVIGSAVSGRPSNPVLGCVRFGEGKITSTCVEMQIDIEVDGLTGEPFAVPFSRLQSIATACDADSEVTIDSSGKIACGAGRWKLPTVSVAEFPLMQPPSLRPAFRVPADQFARAAKQVLAAKIGGGGGLMSSLHCDVTDGVVTLVCTDGKRLYLHELEIDQAVDDVTLNIPPKAATTLVNIATASDESVQVEHGSSLVVASCGGCTITSSQMAGSFPKWRKVIPERDNGTQLVATRDLMESVTLARIVTSESSRAVCMKFADGRLEVSGQSSEYGQGVAGCDLVEPGPQASVCLDPGFVVDWLGGVDPAEIVEVDVVDNNAAVLLRCEDSKAVIMPLSEAA